MDELKFVFKCLVFSVLVLAMSQLKIENETLETRVQAELLSTGTADFVNKAAQGGAKLIRHGMAYVKAKVNHRTKEEKVDESSSSVQAASSTSPEQALKPQLKSQNAATPDDQMSDESSDLNQTE